MFRMLRLWPVILVGLCVMQPLEAAEHIKDIGTLTLLYCDKHSTFAVIQTKVGWFRIYKLDLRNVFNMDNRAIRQIQHRTSDLIQRLIITTGFD